MTQDEVPVCEACGELLTINHIVTECQKLEDHCNQFHISDQICTIPFLFAGKSSFVIQTDKHCTWLVYLYNLKMKKNNNYNEV